MASFFRMAAGKLCKLMFAPNNSAILRGKGYLEFVTISHMFESLLYEPKLTLKNITKVKPLGCTLTITNGIHLS